MDDAYLELDALVIEDDEIQRKITVQALKVLGFASVRDAEDGETGLRACMDKLPDVIVCDIEMMPMDGMTFLRALRRTRMLKVREIPVVFLTTHNESATVQEAVKLGVDAFIVKPPTLKSLKSRIDAVLGIT
ncbi:MULTISPECIES: response regulator [Thalassobaculum]|uniref:Two-component system, chemotaxis family, response regulator CheY n=1 Tax=Thalassobaculum litoreum DSM 18839 TaxID=1123362 RepID=A0A8G2EXY2_9PROT|nr:MULTISPECIES: response regulator [Thalassobaculum]SDF40275.1 two-component system, chemotaxis family, response regulator CheY [Thalassobaculum litoreum DSM 18839]